MLALDESLQFIEATEADVVSVYRSNSAIFMAPEGLDRQPCEAYLCVIRKDDKLQIYTALVLGDSKDVLIYTLIPDSANASHQKNLSSALKAMEEMGFAMEPINLSYGTALREVVVKSINILKPPGTQKAPAKKVRRKTPIKSEPEIQETEKLQEPTVTETPKKETVTAPKVSLEAPKQTPQPEKAEPVANIDAPKSGNQELEKKLSEKDAELQLAAIQIAELKAQLSELSKAKEAIEQAAADDLANLQAEWEDLFENKSASDKVEMDRLETAKDEAEKVSAEALAQLNEIKKQADATTVESTAKIEEELNNRLSELEVKLDERESTIAALQNELEAKSSELSDYIQKTTADMDSLKNEIKDIAATKKTIEESLEMEISRMTAELEKLSTAAADHEAAAARLAFLEKEYATLKTDKAAVSDTANETADALRSELEILSADYAKAVQARDSELDQLKASLQQANEAQKSIEESMADNIAMLQKELEETRTRLADVQKEQSTISVGKSTSKESGSEAEVERLISEKASLELMIATERTNHQNELQRLTIEKITAERVATEEVAALKSAVARLATEKVAAEQRIFEQMADGKAPESQPKTAYHPPPTPQRGFSEDGSLEPPQTRSNRLTGLPSLLGTSQPQRDFIEKPAAPTRTRLDKSAIDKAIADLAAASSDAYSSTAEDGDMSDDSSEGPVSFNLDKNIPLIALNNAAELSELHKSLNMARINPEGYKTQNCSCYISVINRENRSVVTVSLYLTESNVILVYVPPHQPTANNVHKMVQDAILFAETVGFMMDIVPLPTDNEARISLISSIPVFDLAT
jgi:uncharacterized coiled-coil protein SlyX